MSLQDSIIEEVLDSVIDEEIGSTILLSRDMGGYYKFAGSEDLYTSREVISKLIEIAEGKVLRDD